MFMLVKGAQSAIIHQATIVLLNINSIQIEMFLSKNDYQIIDLISFDLNIGSLCYKQILTGIKPWQLLHPQFHIRHDYSCMPSRHRRLNQNTIDVMAAWMSNYTMFTWMY